VNRRDRVKRDQGGFVLPLFATMLVVLLGFAGIGVDVWNWYLHAGRLQRAADAGALAGVVFMPADPAQAGSTATASVNANGYSSGISVGGVDGRPSRLRVEVQETVNNNFLRFFGNDTTRITRDATAEFQGPVPMGSPVNQLGNDPFGDQSDATVAPRFWLNVAGPNANTQNGDRHQARFCAGADNCDGSSNEDYEELGYFFTVDVRSLGSGPLRFQAYDPGFFYVGDRCDQNLFATSDGRLATLAAQPGMSDAAQRYVLGNNRYCTGDQDVRGRDIDTTFIVRAPDNTSFTHLDNTIVCSVRFIDRNGDATALFNQLMDTTVLSPEGMQFRQFFRQWADLCVVNSPQVGEYIVQVRSNAPGGNPDTYDSSINTGGHNRYSLRAGFGSSSSTVDGSTVGLFADGRLPIYVNEPNPAVSSTTFYLARVEPLAANRTLELNFFDIGDVSGGSVTLTILPPDEATTSAGNFDSFPNCQFTPRGYPTENLSGCSRSGMASGSSPVPFQGRITQVLIPIPSDYQCNSASFETGCWVRVRMTMPSGTSPNDTTTWSANILGDPVRLVE
jgi:hypothetical protein